MLAHVVAVWTQCNSNQPGLFGTKILNYADTQLYVSVSLRCEHFMFSSIKDISLLRSHTDVREKTDTLALSLNPRIVLD